MEKEANEEHDKQIKMISEKYKIIHLSLNRAVSNQNKCKGIQVVYKKKMIRPGF